MEVFKRMVLVLGILIFSIQSFSQNNDSIPPMAKEGLNPSQRAAAIAAAKFTIARPLNIEFTQLMPYNFTLKDGNNSYPDSKVKGLAQAKINTNINIIQKKNWLFGTTLGYNYISVKADMTEPFSQTTKNVDNDFHYFHAAANVAYISTLFKKRTVFTSSIIVDGSEKHFERIRGLLSGTMVLKANERTKMSVGFVIPIDPLSEVPFIPTFSYEHKLRNGLIVDIILPKNLYLRKHVFSNGRLSLGAEMDGTTFYLYNIDGTDQKYQYRQLDINSGFVYEHLIANSFLITGKAGVRFTPSGRLFRKQDSYSDPVLKMSADPAFYFNIGISFSPSLLIGKKK
ncbi:hypothetical protein IR083_18040 [Dysgonomonas sp. GY75]|nr:hypothetical protein [Dysgonomonas sp. GY75]